MNQVQVTSLSSKGQVVIPGNIRKNMKVEAGTKFVIFVNGDNLLLKPIKKPDLKVFEELVKESQNLIKKTKIKKTDVPRLIKKVRNENRSGH